MLCITDEHPNARGRLETLAQKTKGDKNIMQEPRHEEHHERHKDESHDHHGHESVEVTVDGNKKEVMRGEYLVAEFKKLVGVDATKDLDEIIKGEIKPLQDTDKVHIKGCEIFISHARTGGSSHDHGRR